MSFSQIGEQIKVEKIEQAIPVDIPVIPELDQVVGSDIMPLPIIM
jgi:hypothetical protein